MASKILMPQLGESVVEGTIVQWFVKVGDAVTPGTALVEVETDKANTEVPATESGVVLSILARPGEVVAVGRPLLELGAEGSAASAAPAAAAPAPAPAPVAVVPAPVPAPAPMAAAPAPSAAEPPAGGGLLAGIRPASSGGSLIPPRVSPAPAWSAPAAVAAAAAAAPAPAPAPAGPFGAPPGLKHYKPAVVRASDEDTVIRFSKRRAIIAEHMVYSKHVSPHVPCVAEVDMSAVFEVRRQHKDRLAAQGISLTVLAFLLKATTQALREFPGVNAVVGSEEIIQRGRVHLGCAVETEEGLVVPVIRDADTLSVGGLAKAVADLAEKARTKKITVDDLSGGTFTVSNPGRRGNLFGAAVINQPQVGILRMGEIVRRPVVREIRGEEVICIRPMMYLSLSYDHRIIDGVTGNGFLYRVRELLEQGNFQL